MALSYESLLGSVQNATEKYEEIRKLDCEKPNLGISDEERAKLAEIGKKLEDTTKLLFTMEDFEQKRQQMNLEFNICDDASYQRALASAAQKEEDISKLNEEIIKVQKMKCDKEEELRNIKSVFSKARSDTKAPSSELMKDVQASLEWNLEMLKVLKNLTGVSVLDVTEHGFTISTKYLKLQIFVESHQGHSYIRGVCIEEPTYESRFAPFNDKSASFIIEESKARNDIPFLISELDSFYLNRKALDEELNELSKHFPLSIVKREVIITLNEGFVLTINITNGYPGKDVGNPEIKKGKHAELVEIDSLNGMKLSDSEMVKEKYFETVDRRESSITAIVRDVISLLS